MFDVICDINHHPAEVSEAVLLGFDIRFDEVYFEEGFQVVGESSGVPAGAKA